MAQFVFETEWKGGRGAVDRSQRLSEAVASAAGVLAASVAQDAGGAETPGSLSRHLDSLHDAGEHLVRALESMAAQVIDMQRRNVLISVSEQDAQAERAGEAVASLKAASDEARRLSARISDARRPLLDLALTSEAGSVVWERYG